MISWRKSSFFLNLEIPFLRRMGICLSLIHLLTAYSWYFGNFYFHYTPGSTLATCHAFWMNCLAIQLPLTVMISVLIIYAAGSVATATLFYLRKSTLAWVLLALLTVFKLCFFVLRFNVMGNYHLLHFFVVAVFLLLPQKKLSLHLSLVFLYFLAGTLKLNNEWLSGAALVEKPILEGKWLSWALCYVVVLELVVSWGLLSRHRWVRLATLFQLAVFHIFSWHLVGYFYPSLMFLLLAPFFLEAWAGSFAPFRWRDLRPATFLFFFTYLLFQMKPLFFNQDPALQGRFRSFRINMLDARPQCIALALLSEKNKVYSLHLTSTTSMRTRCDTSTFESQLRKFCARIQPAPKIHYILYSKRELDQAYKIVENTPQVCRRYGFKTL